MIQKLFFILLISCSLFSACSDEGAAFVPMPEMDASEQEQALLTISLTLPQAAETRSQTNQDGGTEMAPEVALDKECRVQNAWIILGALAEGQQAPLRISQIFYIKQFQYAGNPAQWSATVSCKPGRYRVVVIANPGTLFTAETLPKDWDLLARYVVRCSTYEALQTNWTDNYFLMTSAYQGKADDLDVVLEVGQHTHKNLSVQRTCARFDYQVANEHNQYLVPCRIGGTQQALNFTVSLDEAALMNVSNNFNLFKMVVSDHQLGRVPDFYQSETSFNYVYDSDWYEKRIFHNTPIFEDWRLKEFFFFPSERKEGDTAAPLPLIYHKLPVLSSQNTVLAYASENTLPGTLVQVNKLSTGVVFKGSFRLPEAHAPVKEVYYRSLRDGNEVFLSLEALKQQLTRENYLLPLELTDDALAQLGVVKFTQSPDGSFPVYYTYWNRHNDNQKPQEMGIMEFAVVRNNIYKLQVTKISSLGLPLSPDDPKNPWKPVGDTPDEQLPQMEVTVKVLDWVEREMVHEI